MRLLSWLLMGSLTHTSLLTYRRDQIGQHGVSVHYHSQQSTHSMAMPVPHDASCHIAGNFYESLKVLQYLTGSFLRSHSNNLCWFC